jgi:predicted dehydrogenase
MRRPLAVAILGVAHHHAAFRAEAIGAHPGAVLARVLDSDPARALAFAARHRSVVPLDLASAIAEVDAVAITSETAAHEPLIAAGELAEIRLVRVRHGHAHGLDPAFLAGWWTDPTLSGGGTLLDEGIHAADLLRWLFGDPAEAMAMISAGPGRPVEDSGIALFRWDNGMLGEIVTGWTMLAADTSVEIFGTRGTALVSGVDLASRGRQARPGLSLCLDGGQRFEPRGPEPRFSAGGFHQAVATAFIDALLAGAPPPVTLADALGAQCMIEAAALSARTGRAVRLDQAGL